MINDENSKHIVRYEIKYSRLKVAIKNKHHMMKIYIYLVLILLSIININGQTKTEEFEIKPSKKRFSNALYNKILYYDNRGNKSNFGILKIGNNNSEAIVRPKYPMEEQIFNLFNSLIDSSAKNGQLLLEIKKFELSETLNEIGYNTIKANMYCITADKCYKINSIDTIAKFDFGVDVSGMILASGTNIISKFIHRSLYKTNTDSIHFENILKIEKEKQPYINNFEAYKKGVIKDGLYFSFEAFKNQVPEYFCIVKKDSFENVSVKAIDGDSIEIENNLTIYMAVHKGVCYYNFGNNSFVELTREDSGFYFNKYIDVETNIGKNLLKGFSYGTYLSGGLMPIYTWNVLIQDDVPRHKKVLVKMKLDHLTGELYLVKKLK